MFIKKLISLALFLLLSISIVGCGNSDSNTNTNTETNNQAQEQTEEAKQENTTKEIANKSEYTFPESATSTDDCKLVVATAAGTSEEGKAILFVQEDTMIDQIGVDLENFDGDKEVYFFINQIYKSKEQGGEMVQTALDLSEDLLKEGEYTLSAVQFENNDPNSNVLKYSEAKYEIK
jgi:hypothetical protein